MNTSPHFHLKCVYLCSIAAGPDCEERKGPCSPCGDGGPLGACWEEDLGCESQRAIETPSGMESGPWGPTEPGCHIGRSDWVKDDIC